MPVLAIPDPRSIELSQAAELAAQIEVWAESCDDVDELDDTRAKLAAIEQYLRSRNESVAKEIARADRKLEVRIGVLLPARGPGRPPAEQIPVHGDLPSQRAAEFRKIAEHRDDPEVAEAIDEGASRAEVLRRARAAERVGHAKVMRLADLIQSSDRPVDLRLEFRERWGAPQEITESVFDEALAWLEQRARDVAAEMAAEQVAAAADPSAVGLVGSGDVGAVGTAVSSPDPATIDDDDVQDDDDVEVVVAERRSGRAAPEPPRRPDYVQAGIRAVAAMVACLAELDEVGGVHQFEHALAAVDDETRGMWADVVVALDDRLGRYRLLVAS